MSRVPDWVVDSKLETHFLPGAKRETVHTYYEQESLTQRPIKKSEHWQREKKIGDGGFGEVWLEKCTKGKNHGNHVRATKEMSVRRQYERCFVKSFGWYQTESSLFIAMEYLELGDLQDYLHDQKQPLPEFEVQGIMSQILEGLDLMHDNGYAHRDLKPNNILLRSCPPNDWWVKIADFGISKRIEDSLGKPTTMRGTEGYIAPELYELTKRGTPYAADIWAAGETMFQLLTKQPAFKHVGLLFNYVQTPNIFPSNQLLANEVTQLGVEFVLCLMHPTPVGRMSAKDALQHRWIDQALPYNRKSAPLAYKEAHTTSSLELVTEEFASWNSIKSPESPTASTPDSMTGKFTSRNTAESPDALETFVPRRIEELELSYSYLQTASNETVTFQPVHQKAATAIKMWLPSTIEGHPSRVTSVASPDGRLVASGCYDSTIKLWDTITGGIHKTLGHSGKVTSVAFSPDSEFLAAGSDNNIIIIWRTIDGTIRKTLRGYSRQVNSVAFSPDGVLLAFGCDDNTVELWTIITGAIHGTLQGHLKPVNSVVFSPDGKLVASGSDDKTVKLWHTTGSLYRTLEGHSGGVTSVALSPDGKLVASGSDDRTVRLWHTTGGLYKVLWGHSNRVQSVTFSPNTKLVASASLDGTVKLWDTITAAISTTLPGHSDRVQSVAISPDGTLVLSGSKDDTIMVWHLRRYV